MVYIKKKLKKYYIYIYKYIPRGMIAIVIGSVSKAFLPCLSERLPIKGVTISVPKPVTYINFNLLSNITKKFTRTGFSSNFNAIKEVN